MKIAIVNCFDTYGERVNYLYDFFLEKGNNVIVITSDFQHFAKKKLVLKKQQYIYIPVPEYKKNLSMQRLKSHRVFAERAVEEIQNRNIQLIYALVPPNSVTHEVAVYKKKNPEVKVIFDLIDLWPETLPIPILKNSLPMLLWRNLRDKNLCYADFVITECDLYQRMLKDILYNCKKSTLYLARKFEENVISYNERDTLDVCYLGSINNIVDIRAIHCVLSQLTEEFMVVFHIIGKGERKNELYKKLKKLNIKVVDYGVVYDKKRKYDIFSSCDFGFNIMKTSVCVGLTMKSIDYFEAGLPVINNIQADTYDIIEKYGIGINLNKKNYVDIDKVRHMKENMADIRMRVRQVYQKYFTYSSFYETMEEIYTNIVGEK